MLIQGGEVTALETAPMSGNPLGFVKELDGRLGQAHLEALVDEPVRHAVVVVIDHHVIIDVEAAGFDDGRAGVIGNRQGRHPAIGLIGVHVRADPGMKLLVRERLGKDLARNPQRGDEQRPGLGCAVGPIADGDGLTGPRPG